MSKRIIALLLAAIMVLCLAACGQTATTPEPTTTPETTTPTTTPATTETTTPAEPEKDARYGGDLQFVNNVQAQTLDPMACNSQTGNYQWMEHVLEAPLCHSDGGEVFPLICDYELSDDGLVLKLTVRDGYCFSTGEQVTPEDILASFERQALVSTSFAPNNWDFLEKSEIEGSTLTLTYSKLIPTLVYSMSSLSGPYVMPKEICEKYGADPITDPADVIGTGPYVLTEYNPDIRVVMSRNENYVPTMNDATGPAAPRMAYCDTITYNLNKDEASRTAGMIAGDYDIGGIMSSMQPYANQIGLKRNLLANQWTHGIKFNLSDENANSPVADVNVRKAIRAAIDCQAAMIAVIQADDPERYILDPESVVAGSPYHTDLLTSPEADFNVHDIELAKKYLAESSYNGEEIIWCTTAGSAYDRIATILAPMCQEAGLNIVVNYVDSGSASALRSEHTGWDIWYAESQKSLNDPTTNSWLSSTAYGFWHTPKHEELLTEMKKYATGSKEAIELYEQIIELAIEEVPWVYYGHNLSTFYSKPNVYWNYQGMEQYCWNAYFED